MAQEKILITSGCSVTEVTDSHLTWPHWVEKEILPKKHYNEAHHNSSNDLISRRTIYRVEQLLQSKVSPDNIVLLITWSGPRRFELYNPIEKADEVEGVKKYINAANPEDFTSYIDAPNNEKRWLCYGWDQIYDDDHVTYRNREITIIRTLELILMVQLYLNSRNVKYIMMTCRDIFSVGELDEFQRVKFIKDSLSKDNTPEARFLWDIIDFDKFLFPETSFSKYGGLLEYAIDHDVGWQHENSSNPHEDGHKMFVDEILLPEIKNTWQI